MENAPIIGDIRNPALHLVKSFGDITNHDDHIQSPILGVHRRLSPQPSSLDSQQVLR